MIECIKYYKCVAQDKCSIFVVQSGPKLLADIISLFYMCVKHIGSRSENWSLIITMSSVRIYVIQVHPDDI